MKKAIHVVKSKRLLYDTLQDRGHRYTNNTKTDGKIELLALRLRLNLDYVWSISKVLKMLREGSSATRYPVHWPVNSSFTTSSDRSIDKYIAR